jgi:hypothetical protein
MGPLLDKMVKGMAPKPQADEPEDRHARLFANDGKEGIMHLITV